MAAKKISVSLEAELVAWLGKRAERSGASVSAVIAQAVESLQQHEARLRVLESLGGPAAWDAVEAELRRFTEAVAHAKEQRVPDNDRYAAWAPPEERRLPKKPLRLKARKADVEYVPGKSLEIQFIKPVGVVKRPPKNVEGHAVVIAERTRIAKRTAKKAAARKGSAKSAS